MKWLIATAALLLAVVGPAVAAADDGVESVEVWGESQGSGEDAKIRALDDAFVRAVRQVAAVRLPAELSVAKRRAVTEDIYKRARRFVASYRVAQEEEREGTLRVRTLVRVKGALLDEVIDGLGISAAGAASDDQVTARALRPAVVVVGAVEAGAASQSGVRSSAEVAAGEVGLELKKLRSNEAVSADAAAVEAAKAAGAGGVIRFSVRSEPQGRVRGTELYGAVATATVRVLQLGASDAIVESSASAASFAAAEAGAETRAASEAVALALRAARPRLDDRWPAAPTRVSGIAVSIAGLRSFGALSAIEQHVLASRGKVSIAGRRMGHGMVLWTVSTELSASQLAALLRSAPVPSGSIRASARSNRVVEVQVRDFGGGA